MGIKIEKAAVMAAKINKEKIKEERRKALLKKALQWSSTEAPEGGFYMWGPGGFWALRFNDINQLKTPGKCIPGDFASVKEAKEGLPRFLIRNLGMKMVLALGWKLENGVPKKYYKLFTAGDFESPADGPCKMACTEAVLKYMTHEGGSADDPLFS